MPGHELIGSEELEAITSIFTESQGVLFAHGFDHKRNGRFRVRELESAAAEKVGTTFCQAVSSGTAAVQVALHALGVGPGDEVITQSFTFVASIEGILALGAIPVVVDIDKTLNMCPKNLEQAITSRTKCIMPVHMMGTAANLTEILPIAKQRRIPVLEDACQAFGGSMDGSYLGTIGDAGVISLDFNKTITAGEGGLIFTNNAMMKETMSAYHDHGHENDPRFPRGCDTASNPGYNFRLTELQAAVASAQLGKLDHIVASNRHNKTFLKEGLSQLGDRIEFRHICNPQEELADSVMFFMESADQAQEVVGIMTANQTPTKNVPDAIKWHFAGHWQHLWKTHPVYANTMSTQWAKSFELLQRCISLPVNVLFTEEEMSKTIDTVVHAVRKVTG